MLAGENVYQPQGHEAPKNGVEDFDDDGIAGDDGECPLVDAISEGPAAIEAHRNVIVGNGVVVGARVAGEIDGKREAVAHLLGAGE